MGILEYFEFILPRHRGLGGLYTCIIRGGRGFESSRRRLLILLLSSQVFNNGLVHSASARNKASFANVEKRRERKKGLAEKRARSSCSPGDTRWCGGNNSNTQLQGSELRASRKAFGTTWREHLLKLPWKGSVTAPNLAYQISYSRIQRISLIST